ncbi:carboxypeptidase-like regulatory domain-containing protein [Xanthomonas sp. XNM01]|uniref:carboxypeptidase-like regulatory domain-containing protein n=1 Tax=Xanthomonas sp. XNM01 TaxID=2769289 RepID=UPI001CE09EBF|nr:carboxypeptidase-like regulatory domain-containing protein [Xanthomonas sp. XNM01]
MVMVSIGEPQRGVASHLRTAPLKTGDGPRCLATAHTRAHHARSSTDGIPARMSRTASKCFSVVASVVASTLLAGCVPYPVYKTLQPEAQVTVLAPSGQPIAGAEVQLIASAYPYGRERSRETATTGTDGRAWFPARREWRTEALALHGAEVYFWNWCIRAPGYRTRETTHGSAAEFEGTLVARMDTGESTPCQAAVEPGRAP